jgi:hypothetical protein
MDPVRLPFRPLCVVAGAFACLWLQPAAAGNAAPADALAAGEPAGSRADAGARTEAALGRADLTAYRGWLKYLRLDAETEARRSGAASEAAAAKARRLDEWLRRVEADPRLLGSLRGVQEWAYESPVDGSGQPFRIDIPTDYDPARPAPLAVYMHGYSGNHIEHSTGMVDHPGFFEVSVLGRSRGGGYISLSEADVLQVVDYVEAHWAIDPDRVSLNGGSMGGGGTYRLGSRYPQRWCSGRTTCGFASCIPMGNLLTLPIYATHSADDPTVSVLHEVGPLARLRDMGGRVIFDETNGYGHAVWDYKEGNARGLAWERFQVRPDSRTVRRIDYTALDGGAVRGWWAEVAEWGPAPTPARFVLAKGNPNLLFADLTNIARLRLRLAESPFDRSVALQVSVNGAVPVTLPAPLPETAVLSLGAGGWGFEAKSEALPYRLHTPGGAALLYEGEPLLIVFGTGGSGAARAAMRLAAAAAARSPNAGWPDDSGAAGTDKVPHSQNLYGSLNVKADVDVTDGDIARCHLVLIGTAEQNAVVARLADSLPVRFDGAAAACSDGEVIRADGPLMLGLVHYNPLSPQRLIFWVASGDPAAYAAGSEIPSLMGGGDFRSGSAVAADLLVMSVKARALVADRGFDSRWRWAGGRESSPLVPAGLGKAMDLAIAVGEAVRRAAAADYVLVGTGGSAAPVAVTPGVTRVCDIVPLYSNLPIGMFEVTGAELLGIARSAAAKDSNLLIPGLDPANIRPAANYRVALPVNVLWAFSAAVQPAPARYWMTGLDAGETVGRFLPGQ